MTTGFFIKNALVVDPAQNIEGYYDVWVVDGKVKAIEPKGRISKNKLNNEKIIDAKGLIALPGCIDLHVHLREPGMEYKETIQTGTRAAIAGGFTSVACMANTLPVNDTARNTAMIRDKAKAEAACRVFPIGAVSKGLQGKELAEIGGMSREGAVAFSDDGMPVMNSFLMRQAMLYAKGFGKPIISHAEDAALTHHTHMHEGFTSEFLGLKGNPVAAEEIMVAREIALSRSTGCHVHLAHVSTRVALEHIARAKEEGLSISAEVTPHHLLLTDHAVLGYDTHCKMAPPLRSEEDRAALVEALASGVIDVIATDHAPHGVNDKRVEFDRAANGITGLELALPLTYGLVKNKKLKLRRWVEALTAKPAKILGLPFGSLRKGSAADITLFDPNKKWTWTKNNLQSKSHNSPFFEKDILGKVVMVFLDGTIAYETTH